MESLPTANVSADKRRKGKSCEFNLTITARPSDDRASKRERGESLKASPPPQAQKDWHRVEKVRKKKSKILEGTEADVPAVE